MRQPLRCDISPYIMHVYSIQYVCEYTVYSGINKIYLLYLPYIHIIILLKVSLLFLTVLFYLALNSSVLKIRVRFLARFHVVGQ